MAGGTPAFPAQRVLGARASRSHGGNNALLGNAASRHARKKPTPLSLKVPPARRGNRTRARFPSRSGGNLQEVQPENRPRMEIRAFLNGYRPQGGERLG